MTHDDYLEQARKENPKPIYAIINGVQIELTDDEYEKMIDDWATMKVEQDNPTPPNSQPFGPLS